MRLEQLFESTGGIAQRWLEQQAGKSVPFQDGRGRTWELQDLQFFPPNPQLAYEDQTKGREKIAAKDILLSSVTNYLRKLYPYTKFNIVGAVGKAGMLVVLKSKNQTVAYLKLAMSKRDIGKNSIFWQTSDFTRATGLALQTGQARTSAISLEPSDLITPGSIYTIDHLLEEIGNRMQDMTLPDILKNSSVMLLRQIQLGETQLISGLAEYRPAIENKLGELAAPIALMTGNFLTGQYRDVEMALLRPLGLTYHSLQYVSFPNRSEGLIDSFVHLKDGRKIGISSKDSRGGAAPSISTLAQVLRDKSEVFDEDRNFEKKFGFIRDCILQLDQQNAVDGPIELAVRFRLISRNDANYITEIYGRGKISDKVLRRDRPELYQLLKSASYSPDSNNMEYQTGYHLLAIVARMVADRLNKNAANTTEFFKAVLNQSDIVQIYSSTTVSGDALCYKNFKVVFPSTFQGKISVSAEKRYTSRHKVRGKLSFEFQT